MLPTPHGPTDAPLPAGSDDAAVDTGRTVDEVALLRVVEHLADVPDGDADDAAPPGEDAGEDAGVQAPAADADTSTEAPAAEAPVTDDEAPVSVDEAPGGDEPTDEDVVPDQDAVPDQGAATADVTAHHDAPAVVADDAAEPAPPATEVEVGPVAAALSDTSHRIDELNAFEQLFLAQQRSMIIGLCPDPSDPGLVSALFDRVREQWTQAEDRPDLRPLADAFGVALGDLVCARAPHLTWATFSDRFGTEIVLARREPELVVYPIAAVAQNWQEAAPGWLLRHLAIVVQGVVPELSSSDA